jgi:hypothetical protein
VRHGERATYVLVSCKRFISSVEMSGGYEALVLCDILEDEEENEKGDDLGWSGTR